MTFRQRGKLILKTGKFRSFSMARLARQIALIYLLSVTFMFLSVVAANLIPNDAILASLRRSLPTENYQVLFGSTRTDQHAECVVATIGLGPQIHELGLVQRSILSPTLGNCEQSWKFLRTGINEGRDYWRYWHGTQIIQRPALAIASVLDVRALTLFLFASSFMFAFLALYRNGLQVPAFAMFAGLFFVPLQSALFVLPHAMDWIIGFLACGWLIMRVKGDAPLSVYGIIGSFFFVGMLTAFFGALTEPLLSLTIPLFGLFWAGFIEKKEQAPIGLALIAAATCSWLIGYAASWSTKWLLAAVLVDGVVSQISNVVNFRLGGSFHTTAATSMNSIQAALHQVRTPVILVAVFFIVSLLALIRLMQTIRPNWSDLASFIFISAIPFAWMTVLRNHTIVHAFFVSAMLYISFAMVLTLILTSWAIKFSGANSVLHTRRDINEGSSVINFGLEADMSLHTPKAAVFIISLILFVIAWIGYFAAIPYIGDHPSFLITLAYVVVAIGCFL
jgi:hypothetical protein